MAKTENVFVWDKKYKLREDRKMREIDQGMRDLGGGEGANISGGTENCRIYKRL